MVTYITILSPSVQQPMPPWIFSVLKLGQVLLLWSPIQPTQTILGRSPPSFRLLIHPTIQWIGLPGTWISSHPLKRGALWLIHCTPTAVGTEEMFPFQALQHLIFTIPMTIPMTMILLPMTMFPRPKRDLQQNLKRGPPSGPQRNFKRGLLLPLYLLIPTGTRTVPSKKLMPTLHP